MNWIEIQISSLKLVTKVLHCSCKSITVTIMLHSTTTQLAEVTCDEEEETATFRFKTALAAGTATLVVEYVGSLNDKMKGFYRTKYYLPSAPDKELYAAVTQFEVCP